MAELYCRPIEGGCAHMGVVCICVAKPLRVVTVSIVYSAETEERLNVYQCGEKTDNAPLRLL